MLSPLKERPPFAGLEVPRALRALVRAHEASFALLGALIGAVAGLVVAAMSFAVALMHALLFGVGAGQRLSALTALDPMLALLVPTIGGLAFGGAMHALGRWRPGREVDPIEANALHGGRMSLTGSFMVALQTVWSSGVGASVGLEAGYTQLASGLASRVGQAFHLRRQDLRLLVGCGAAGAIAGAFGAPLAGAFYAFELIIGSYSIACLAPVGIAALLGYVVASLIEPGGSLGIGAPYVMKVGDHDLVIAGVVGLLAAGAGIALMIGVAQCERTLNWLRIPVYLRPGIGGLIVGTLALVTPQVLSSGHGAIHTAAVIDSPLREVVLLLALKALASMVSLGTGFRGGLFFASLLLGTLLGRLFADASSMLWPTLPLDAHIYAIIGLGAFSVSVIGAPLTMTFIALETTGDFWLTAAVLVAVIVSALVTREMFGYSFATWRFHLRGETIRSAADVGWLRDLTVRRMMRPDVRTVPANTTLSRFRAAFPLGSNSHIVAVDENKDYAGIAVVAEAHAAEQDETKCIRDILHFPDMPLLPTMTVKEAVAAFDTAEAEALAVIQSRDSRKVVGLLSEAHALRRYSEELEMRRRELIGE